MFKPNSATAAIPAQDFDRAKSFYADKLGLKPVDENEQEAHYQVGESRFLLFPSTGKASGDHTQLGFEVDELDPAVSSLRENGVVFEEYDFPGFRSVDGIVEVGGIRGAWFKDSEGNLLAVSERGA